VNNPMFSQKDTSWMSPFYVFKTKNDFFNNTKTFYGRWTERSDTKITLHKNGKKFKVNLKDSIVFGFDNGSDYRYINIGNAYYCKFAYGTSDYFAVVNDAGPNYSTTYESDSFQYFDSIAQISTRKIEELLVNTPSLLQAYKNQKDSTPYKAWQASSKYVDFEYFAKYVNQRTAADNLKKHLKSIPLNLEYMRGKKQDLEKERSIDVFFTGIKKSNAKKLEETLRSLGYNASSAKAENGLKEYAIIAQSVKFAVSETPLEQVISELSKLAELNECYFVSWNIND
jgi:hypothetical protein